MKLHRFIAALSTLCTLWAVEGAKAQDWVYRVQLGDTLWDLCLEYTAKQGCWMELGKYNNISKDRRMAPGSEIRIPVDWLLHVPVVGKALNVNGDVSYQSRKGAAAEPLTAGQDIALGSQLISKDGSALIQLGSHSEILLRPDSILEISDTGTGGNLGPTSKVNLERGEVEVKVKPESRSRFEVHTPSAIAAVRGTQYRVASLLEEASTRSEVVEGLVAVEAGSSVDVPAGFGIKASAGEPLGEPRKLLAPPRFEQARIDAPVPVTVRWAGDALAAAWQLDVYAEEENGTLLYSERLTKPALALKSFNEGCYRVVARAVDGEGFNGLEKELPVCVLPPPPVAEEEPDYWRALPWLGTLALILIL